MQNFDMDSIIEYAVEKIKQEIRSVKGSKIKDIDIDDIGCNDRRLSFQVIGYDAKGKPVSDEYFSCSLNFEDAATESEDDIKWLIDNNAPEFAYNFVKNPVRPSLREDAEYNIQFYQIFSNPEKPTDNGKMIAQAGTEEEAKAKGDELVGKGNYLIKAVCDDGKVRDVDLHDYFNKSSDLKEYYRGEDALDDVLSWLQDHKQAWDDFTAHFSDVEDEDLTYDMVVDWISEHDTLYDDYLQFFELDESLTTEGVALKENSTNSNSRRLRKEYLLDVFDKNEIMELAMTYTSPKNDKQALSYLLKNWDDYYFDDGYEGWLEEHYGGEAVEESVELTADEMKSKHGTDNPDIINAGRPEEERVVLKEGSYLSDEEFEKYRYTKLGKIIQEYDIRDKEVIQKLEADSEFMDTIRKYSDPLWSAATFIRGKVLALTDPEKYNSPEERFRRKYAASKMYRIAVEHNFIGDFELAKKVENDPEYYPLICKYRDPLWSCASAIKRIVDRHRNESLTEGANVYNVTFYMDSLDDNVMSGPSTTKQIMAASKEEAEKKLRDECNDKYYIPTITDIELVESIVTEELKPGDRVYVTVSNRQGNVIKMVSDDVVEVELDGGLYPARTDRFYVDEVELLNMQPEVDDEIDYDDIDPDAVVDSLKEESIEEPELLMDEDLGHTIGTALFCTASIEVCTIGGVDEDGEDVDEPVIFDDKTPVNTILAAIDPDTDAGDDKCAEINQLLNAMPDGYIQVQAYCRGRDMGDRQVYDAYELYDEIRDIFNLDESLNESNNAYTYRGHYIINDGSTWMIKDGNNQVIRSGIATDSEAEEIIDDLDESVDYEDAFVADDDM